jgi:shikimate dehydrogenase
MPVINGKTRILGIIGCPVGHSLSPLMQNQAVAACGLDMVYLPFEVRPEGLENAVNGLRALGVTGFNVTIPHKSSIIPFLDVLDESAEAAGAVNTVKNQDGKLIGYNTDGDGLVRSLADDLEFIPGEGIVMIAGAGGAARGAVAALCRSGAKNIILVNRTASKADELARALGGRYPDTNIISARDQEEVSQFARSSELLINTTSVGMNNDLLPMVELADFSINAKVYDMVYAPPVTPLLKRVSDLGMRGSNGLGMLAGQGELAFRIWTGVLPPQGLMKSVLANICAS